MTGSSAPAEAEALRRGGGGLLALVARAPWDGIGTAALLLSAGVWLWQVSGLFDRSDRLTSLAVWQAWVALGLILVTALSRTLGVRFVVAYFLTGFYGVIGLIRLVGVPLDWVMDLQGDLSSVVVAPLLEETTKALPLVVLAVVSLRNRTRAPSAAGFALLGFAIGAGFGWYENSLDVGGSGAGGPGLNPLSWLWPTAFFEGERVVVVHSGWTALVGAAIGIAFTRRHRRILWLLPVVALGVAMIDHAAANNYVRDGSDWLWLPTLRGWLTVVLLIAAIAVALVLDWQVLHDGDRRDRRFPRPTVAQLTGIASGPGGTHPLACWTYLRARNGAHHLLAQRSALGQLDRVEPRLAWSLDGLRLRAGVGTVATGAAAPTSSTPDEATPSPSLVSALPSAPVSPAAGASSPSPTATEQASSSPAAWHEDPLGRHQQRWWDGTRWTDHVADGGVTATDPVDG